MFIDPPLVTIRMPSGLKHAAPHPFQVEQDISRPRIPHLRRVVATAGDDPRAVRAERSASHPARVSFQVENGLTRPRVPNQHPPHRLGGRGEEMGFAVELLIPDQPHVRLMNQGGGVECVPRSFSSHPRGREPAQFVVDEREEVGGRLLITGRGSFQKVSDLGHNDRVRRLHGINAVPQATFLRDRGYPGVGMAVQEIRVIDATVKIDPWARRDSAAGLLFGVRSGRGERLGLHRFGVHAVFIDEPCDTQSARPLLESRLQAA